MFSATEARNQTDVAVVRVQDDEIRKIFEIIDTAIGNGRYEVQIKIMMSEYTLQKLLKLKYVCEAHAESDISYYIIKW